MSNAIVTYHNNYLKIVDFAKENWIQLSERLIVISKTTLGITNGMNVEDVKTIVQFLKDHYAEFTIEEITHAFNLYAAEKLANDVKPYNVFSTSFIGHVLNSYREMRANVLKMQSNREEDTLLLEETNEETESKKEYYGKRMTDMIIEYYQENSQFPITWDYSAVYLHLESEKKIDIEVEDKKDFFSLVKLELEENANVFRFTNRHEYERRIEEAKNNNMIALECRKRLVQNYIKNQYGK